MSLKLQLKEDRETLTSLIFLFYYCLFSSLFSIVLTDRLRQVFYNDNGSVDEFVFADLSGLGSIRSMWQSISSNSSSSFDPQVFDRRTRRLVEELIDAKIILSIRALYQSKVGLGLMDKEAFSIGGVYAYP